MPRSSFLMTADLDDAVIGAIACKFRNNGQTCVCANRIYVQSGVYDAFATKLKAAVEALRVGDGLDGADLGPLIEPKAVDKVKEHLDDALAKGATVLTWWQAARSGWFVLRANNRDRCHNRYGRVQGRDIWPFAPLFKFDDEDDVIEMPTIRSLVSHPISMLRSGPRLQSRPKRSSTASWGSTLASSRPKSPRSVASNSQA